MIPPEGAIIEIKHNGMARRGHVLELVPESSTQLTLRIRWNDGQETRIDPSQEPSLRVVDRRIFRPRPGAHDSRNFLLKLLPKRSSGAEVGVWKGDFALQMVRIVKPQLLYLVDPWEFMPDPHHAHTRYGGSIAKSKQDMDGVLDLVRDRFHREIEKGIVQIHRGTLTELADSGQASQLDWVYVDGDHNYESVAADLRAAASLVRPGGYITGDDYRLDGWWGDAVIRAAHALISSGNAELELVKRSQYILRRT